MSVRRVRPWVGLLVLVLGSLTGDTSRAQIAMSGGGGSGSSSLTITEIDGAPSGTFSAIKFSNGALTDNGDGTATVVTGVGGGGDASTNTSTSVIGEMVLFAGTGGKTLGRATQTGILKATSGVLGVGVAGTDYVVPAGNVATATALAANGGNCSSGSAPLGVDAAGTSEGCFDVATQAELDTHAGLTNPHSAVATNTPSRLVLRDASGNFAAGTITATLTGNASTATALAADGTNCPAGQASVGVDAGGHAQGCFTPAGGAGGLPDPGANGLVVRNSATPTTINRTLTGTANQIAVANGDGVSGNPTVSIPANPTLPGTTTGTFSGPLTGNASTATALATNGSNCPAGQAATGMDPSGNAEGCFTPPPGDVTSTGDCTSGACLDGTATGGTTLALYDGNSHKGTLQTTDLLQDRIYTLPNESGTLCTTGAVCAGYENVANKSTSTSMTGGATVYPSASAVKGYVEGTAKVISNTAITRRPCTGGPGSPISFNVDNATGCDFIRIVDLGGPTTFNINPTGSFVEGQWFTVELYTTTQRALTFTSGATNTFSAELGLTLPTFSKAGGYVLYGFRYSTVSQRWAFAASSQETNYGTAGYVRTAGGPGVESSWQPATGGATGRVHLPVTAVSFPTSNPAVLDGSETNARLLFDASTSECAYWGPFRMNSDYASVPVLKLQYSMTSATSGGVSINVDVMAVAAGAAVDANTESYATVNNCDDATVPTTLGGIKEISCALTNNDSLAANNLTKIRLCRAVADSADTATGDFEAITATLEYQR